MVLLRTGGEDTPYIRSSVVIGTYIGLISRCDILYYMYACGLEKAVIFGQHQDYSHISVYMAVSISISMCLWPCLCI